MALQSSTDDDSRHLSDFVWLAYAANSKIGFHQRLDLCDDDSPSNCSYTWVLRLGQALVLQARGLFLNIERVRGECFHCGVLDMLLVPRGFCGILILSAARCSVCKGRCLLVENRVSCWERGLITLGDRIAINNASVVGHVNSRGKFDPNRLIISHT